MKTRLFKYIENFTIKNWKFLDKNCDIYHISTQNIDCGYSLELPRQGSSNEYPQSMFWSRSKKNNVYPCKLQFYHIKVGFKGVKISWPASVAQLDAPSDWRPGGPGFNPHRGSNILSWRLIMKYFLRSVSPFRWFKKGSCQFLAKKCAQYWLTA